MASPSHLDTHEPLEIIGTGSFGIIRKVRRKTDGVILARKELNFERMSERDRKQIVAEVNILKELHHEHIVRYHDRFVDRDAGILYILMEYCGGGDLSSIIKQAQKSGRPLSEDTIWKYFLQIVLALCHCHHPNGGHGRSGSGSSTAVIDGGEGKERKAQILHRDLKPENVFLDGSNSVKLGDFGLSKALAQASFANTYVGTPYYMSPELMQEKAYDSKSDIWSLGCLMYELCALKPPFHEAKTHAELSIFIRNGRIPPLPKGYSQALTGVIKAMLNLNPAMRPSAQQLLQHERLELMFKVSETEKMLGAVKGHKANVVARERELVARETGLAEKEALLEARLAEKDVELASLHSLVAQSEARVREAVARRENELREAVMQREEEVRVSMAKREEEIMEAIRRREEEVNEAWRKREEEVRAEAAAALTEQIEWVRKREEELGEEALQLERARATLEVQTKALAEGTADKKVRKEKTPLEEVKNILAPLTSLSRSADRTPMKAPPAPTFPKYCTPAIGRTDMPAGSAMKGVILTTTGQVLETPTPSELAKLFITDSPKVGLNFGKIFDFESDAEGESDEEEETEPHARPDSPSERPVAAPVTVKETNNVPPTRLRRPSIRTSATRPTLSQTASCPLPSEASSSKTSSAISQTHRSSVPLTQKAPSYDLANEENLPSPFLKRVERAGAGAGGTMKGKRPSAGNLLRVMAAANLANGITSSSSSSSTNLATAARPSVANARKASEEARKALIRA